MYELCLEENWRNGVSPLFRLLADFLFCKSGVDDRRSGFRGLDIEGAREGDRTGGCGEEPLRCRLGVFRGVLAGEDGGSGVSAAAARVSRLKFSGGLPVFVDKFRGICASSFSMDGRITS